MTKDTNRSSPRWMRLSLALSVGINLAVVGLAFGMILRGPPDHVDGRYDGGGWSQARALPEPYRTDLRRELRDNKKNWKDIREDIRARRQKFASVLRAEPFEPDAVREALEGEQSSVRRLSDQATEQLLQQIEKMTSAERAEYADSILKERHKRRRRKD